MMARRGVVARACAVVLCFAICLTSAAALTDLDVQLPATGDLPAGTVTSSADLRWQDFAVAPGQPNQVHVSPSGQDSMFVMWAAGNGVFFSGSKSPPDTSQLPGTVNYGTSSSSLNKSAAATAEVYQQLYNSSIGPPIRGGPATLNYTSPILYTANLPSLAPNTVYYYQVCVATTCSGILQFQTLPRSGQSYPMRIGILADLGFSQNSSDTLSHITYSMQTSQTPPAVFYIGDYSYADGWVNAALSPTGPFGVSSWRNTSAPAVGFEGPFSGSWQPVWDAWQNFIQPLVSTTPMLGCPGNHEIEQQDAVGNYAIFKSVQARWKVPTASNFFYYSQEIGPIHAIFLTPYVDYTVGSAQYNWLISDLASVDRARTPWLVVNIHEPWYTTSAFTWKQWEQMRLAMEPILNGYGVDIYFYGHVHAYERTAPMFNYNVDLCGAVHLTVGDGGNSEGLDFLSPDRSSQFHVDSQGGCIQQSPSTRPIWMVPLDANAYDPWTYYQRTPTYQDGTYCPSSQPPWSQFREPSFGHGVLDVLNATHARWQWKRNQDGLAVVADDIYIVRNMRPTCANRRLQIKDPNFQMALSGCDKLQGDVQSACYGCVINSCYQKWYCDPNALSACQTCTNAPCFTCVASTRLSGSFDPNGLKACKSCTTDACATCVASTKFSGYFDPNAANTCARCASDCTTCVQNARRTGYYDTNALSTCY